MGVNRLTGSPWHAERVHRGDDDARRYKGRCKYYSYEEDRCSYVCGNCYGSAHCDYYEAITDAEFKKRQKAQRRKKSGYSDDDDGWF